MPWLAVLLACKDATPAAVGAIHRLTVEGGVGSGEFAAGSRVHVWAEVDPQAALATWTGEGIATPEEWNSGLEMPDHDLVVTAAVTPVSAPLVERTLALVDGDRPVLVSAPEAPSALVLFFHGASYGISQLESNAAATIRMHLVRAGYAVVAVPSQAELSAGTGGWNASLDDANPDLATVRGVVDALTGDGTLPADVPVFAWGMSSGGNFAHTVGAALPAAGVVAYCAPGTPEALAATRAPTGWYLAANDQTFPSGVAEAIAFQAALSVRGVVTELVVHPQTPLYDERFRRIAGVSEQQSADIANAIRAVGAVNAAGNWTTSGSAVLPVLDLADLDAEQRVAVGAEIEIMAADHELYDDVADRMLDFLAHL